MDSRRFFCLDIVDDFDFHNHQFQEMPPVPVYMSFYFYHVLNPDNITAGTEKPRVEERGPYAYKEDRYKVKSNQLRDKVRLSG